MPRIPAVDPQHAPTRAQPMLATVQQQLGVTPNMTRTMAQSPAVLDAWMAMNGALGKGTLGRRVGEQIALAVAEANGCGYCAAAHTLLGRGAGLTDAEVEAARDGRAADPRAGGALALALAVLEARGHVADAAVAAAREARLTDGEIGEVVAHVALNVFTNYFNTVAGTEVDFPAVRAPRGPRATASVA